MRTIAKKVNYLDSELASAIASENVNRPMKSVDRTNLKEMKGLDYVKVVLKTKNSWGKVMQQTYYCFAILEQNSLNAAPVLLQKKECPWACRIVSVKGGYMCFESITDYHTWRRQL